MGIGGGNKKPEHGRKHCWGDSVLRQGKHRVNSLPLKKIVRIVEPDKKTGFFVGLIMHLF